MVDKTTECTTCQHFHTSNMNSLQVNCEACCQWSYKGNFFCTIQTKQWTNERLIPTTGTKVNSMHVVNHAVKKGLCYNVYVISIYDSIADNLETSMRCIGCRFFMIHIAGYDHILHLHVYPCEILI